MKDGKDFIPSEIVYIRDGYNNPLWCVHSGVGKILYEPLSKYCKSSRETARWIIDIVLDNQRPPWEFWGMETWFYLQWMINVILNWFLKDYGR